MAASASTPFWSGIDRSITQDVDAALADEVEGLAAVRRFSAHDLRSTCSAKILTQAGTHDGMVVDDGNTNHEYEEFRLGKCPNARV